MFKQCGIFWFSRFCNCSDSVVFFGFLDFVIVQTVWYVLVCLDFLIVQTVVFFGFLDFLDVVFFGFLDFVIVQTVWYFLVIYIL